MQQETFRVVRRLTLVLAELSAVDYLTLKSLSVRH